MTQSPEEVAATVISDWRDYDRANGWNDGEAAAYQTLATRIASAIRSAVEAETERCAKIASSAVTRADIVSAIRARKESP